MDWKDWDAVCIASGPSLMRDDCEKVRQWRGQGRGVIVVNTSFRIAPWADVLYALDRAWWNVHAQEVARDFQGKCYAGTNVGGAKKESINGPRNSGGLALLLAARFGVKRIVMLGYDCQVKGEMPHWHGKHDGGLGNCGTVKKWPAYFQEYKRLLGSVEVVNASRETALTCFTRETLEDALDHRHHAGQERVVDPGRHAGALPVAV